MGRGGPIVGRRIQVPGGVAGEGAEDEVKPRMIKSLVSWVGVAGLRLS